MEKFMICMAVLAAAAGIAIVCIRRYYRKRMQAVTQMMLERLDRAIGGEMQEEIFDESVDAAVTERLNRLLELTNMHQEQAETERDTIKSIISNITHQIRTPVTNIMLYTGLLQEIVDTSNYEAVILDIGDGVPRLFRLLDQCTRIYMPVRNDPMSQAKIQQFENLLRMSQGETVLEKIQKIRLPYHRTTRKGQGYLDDLVWSELGDYVRELLRKGAEMITQEQEEKKKWGWRSLPKSAGS